jgi:hypothetical protein
VYVGPRGPRRPPCNRRGIVVARDRVRVGVCEVAEWIRTPRQWVRDTTMNTEVKYKYGHSRCTDEARCGQMRDLREFNAWTIKQLDGANDATRAVHVLLRGACTGTCVTCTNVKSTMNDRVALQDSGVKVARRQCMLSEWRRPSGRRMRALCEQGMGSTYAG